MGHDVHSFFPIKIMRALQSLVPHYGRNRPPSMWRPLIMVFDQPNPKASKGNLRIQAWHLLKKSGPYSTNGMTLAVAGTYYDQSASVRYRCDNEILYMLEALTRDYPRRQVLVTNDRRLQNEARRFCTVRNGKWFEEQVLKLGGDMGKEAINVLKGDFMDVEPWFYGVQYKIRKAFKSA